MSDMNRSDSAAIDGQRPLPVRCRRDLVFARRSGGRGGLWTVKDPISLEYFQLRAEELFVLQRLDGRTGPSTIQSEFARRFAPLKLETGELLRFLHRLVDLGLAVTSSAQPVAQSIQRRRRRARKTRWGRLANPLAIRFRGIDPQPLLDRIYPPLRWLFSAPALGACALIVVAAMLLIASNWDAFQHRLPASGAILTATSVFWLMAAVGIVKVLHEFGHALACRHSGGECRELGFMLLAFTPCLYCNVSDVWLLPDKWRRIAVSAAGIGVELTLAGICTFLWWYSEPGAFHSLCFSIMLVTSLGTLFLNGNPLLRYDGYYVLSDFLETPNLRSRATAAVRRCGARVLFGVREPADGIVRSRMTAPLVVYGCAATLYLWFVIVVILRFVHDALKPAGLAPLAVLLAVLVIGGKLVGTGVASTQRVRAWRSAGLIRPVRFSIGCLALTAALAIVLFVPFPFRVSAPCVLSPRDTRSAFVTVPGSRSAEPDAPRIEYGDPVSAGQPVLQLVNHELEQETLRLRTERDRQASVVEGLRLRQFNDPSAAAALPTAEAELRDCDERWRQRVLDEEELVVRAPANGVLWPPPSEDSLPHGRLRREGLPLDERNQDAYLEVGTVVGVVGVPDRFDAVLAVDQADMLYVRAGQSVRLRFGQSAPRIVTGTVTDVDARPLEAAPAPLVLSRRLAAEVDEDGMARPIRTAFQVRVAIDEASPPFVVGGVGEARIVGEDMTLAARLLRLLRTTFVVER